MHSLIMIAVLLLERINYKLAALTYKVRSTTASAPAHLSRHIKLRESAQTLCSSDVLILDKPCTRTEFAKCAFRHSVPSVWNSLPVSVITSDSLPVFKSRLKTHFPFSVWLVHTFGLTAAAPLKLKSDYYYYWSYDYKL